MFRNLLYLIFLVYAGTVQAQSTAVQVSDLQDRPMSGVKLSVAGNGSTSPATDIGGKTQLLLPAGLQPGDPVKLVLIPIANKNLIFYSPWEGQALVPRSTGFIEVVLGARGDVAVLNNSRVLNSFVTTTIAKNRRPGGGYVGDPAERNETFRGLAQQAGFAPETLDKAIREYFTKTDDPHAKALAKSYREEYPAPMSMIYRPERLASEKADKPDKPQ